MAALEFSLGRKTTPLGLDVRFQGTISSLGPSRPLARSTSSVDYERSTDVSLAAAANEGERVERRRKEEDLLGVEGEGKRKSRMRWDESSEGELRFIVME